MPDLSNLTNLENFVVDNNQLTSQIPSISGLTSLQYFSCDYNQLTGSIPSLSGLTSLQFFLCGNNQLTGSIPSLSGLTSLYSIYLRYNQLTGPIPSLSGLVNLESVNVSNNQLTGSIPSLSGLISLTQFYGYNNLLTGSIPSLTGLTNLITIGIEGNRLTGSIPSLSGLTNLQYFYAYNNQLTGSIPSLSGLSSLNAFHVQNNQLTGSIPSLSGLSGLQFIETYNNQLTGDIPPVPSPTNNLVFGSSLVCPNYLNHTSAPAWNAATGTTPWYLYCPVTPVEYTVTYDGNGNTGGSLPAAAIAYLPGEMVTIAGNTGALYKTGNSFAGWNTAANGGGVPYLGGSVFWMESNDNITLYAQWTIASALPVRIFETLTDYTDIQSAYDVALDGQTIEAQDGLGGQNVTFDNPHNYNPFHVKLIGGYNTDFTTDTGATLVSGSIEISSGSVVIEKIIIH